MADVAKLLETLHPMREPPPPAPLTPWLVMTLAGVVLAAAIVMAAWYARHRGGAMRRASEAALAASRGLASNERLAAQALLLRRLVRALAGDREATKQGRAWLEGLDSVFATRFFTEGDGVAFGERLYRQSSGVDVDALDHALCGLLAKVRE